MTTAKLENKKENLQKAFKQLKNFLEIEPPSAMSMTASIKAFEYSFELSWKLMSLVCRLKGNPVTDPRDSIKMAASLELIQHGSIWLDMLDDRNSSVHVYDEKYMLELFLRIKNGYYTEFVTLISNANTL